MSASRRMCPSCGRGGTGVARVTLESLVRRDARSQLDEGGFLFCRTSGCTIVYFNEAGTAFAVSDVEPVVFQKSRDPARLVCYCFSHSVQEVEDEVRRTGSSAVLESVVEKCRDGLDHCKETNPQGSCCLGNIKRLMTRAKAAKWGDPLPEDTEGCCTPVAEAGGDHA